jgi:hypothetical protein
LSSWIVCSGPGLRQVVLPRLRENDERCQRGQDPDQRKVHRPDHAGFQMQRSLAQVILKKKPQKRRISFHEIETKMKDSREKTTKYHYLALSVYRLVEIGGKKEPPSMWSVSVYMYNVYLLTQGRRGGANQ